MKLAPSDSEILRLSRTACWVLWSGGRRINEKLNLQRDEALKTIKLSLEAGLLATSENEKGGQ
jgi:hypothetical protein